MDPVDGEVVIGIGIARSGLAGARRIAATDIAVPGGVGDPIELRRHRLERRIDILRPEAALELRLVELDRRHALARFGRRRSHSQLPELVGWSGSGTSTSTSGSWTSGTCTSGVS